jgi:hypothetical protein
MTDFDGDLVRLVADARAADAARSRSRERNLRTSALTEATLAGVLLDLAERGDRVSVRTEFGRTLSGHVTLVAQDGVVLEGTLGTSYLRFDGIATVRCPASRLLVEPSGDRRPPRSATLAALLADLAPERPRVAIAVTGERALLSGELRAVGSDVVTVAVADGPVYVAARHMSELTVLASG